MKKVIAIFVVMLLFSCKNETVKSSSNLEYEADKEAIIIEENFIVEENAQKNSFQHQNVTQEKLQEFYDLLALQEKHPEFKESLSSQIKNYSTDAINSFDVPEGATIKNIELIGDVIKISDSIKKMKLKFDVISYTTLYKDSLYAKITLNQIKIDGKNKTATKINFSKTN